MNIRQIMSINLEARPISEPKEPNMNGIKRFVSARRPTLQRISHGWFVISMALVLTLLAGCMPVQPVAASEAITLRFAVSDGEGHPTIDPYVYEFVDQVHK